MADRTQWTHVTPRTLDECGADPIIPSWDSTARGGRSKYNCADCGRRIRPMRRNEGPESLAALLRF